MLHAAVLVVQQCDWLAVSPTENRSQQENWWVVWWFVVAVQAVGALKGLARINEMSGCQLGTALQEAMTCDRLS